MSSHGKIGQCKPHIIGILSNLRHSEVVSSLVNFNFTIETVDRCAVTYWTVHQNKFLVEIDSQIFLICIKPRVVVVEGELEIARSCVDQLG